MKSFNIYEYFNSKDIADHCESIGHKFTALEMAYVVWLSQYRTLKQKHKAWQYLIDHYPDELLPESKWLDDKEEPVRKERSLHKFLQHLIDVESTFLASFSKTLDGYLYDYGILYIGDNEYHSDEIFYDNYEACIADLKAEIDRNTCGARITRRKLHSKSRGEDWDEETVHVDSNLEAMIINSIPMEEDWAIKDGFSNMWFFIPTPFQRGDLVTCSGITGAKGSTLVLLHIPYWEGDERGRDMTWYTDLLKKEGGDWTDMQTAVYGLDPWGAICWNHGPNYLLLEYCRDELEDKEKLLLALSKYMKNNISLEELLNYTRH